MFLMPMFDSRPSIFGLPSSVVVMLGALGLMVIGFLWLRHTFEPGPLVRGESRWRYRDRPRLQRIRDWLAEGDQTLRPTRTWGWYVTRLEFGLAAVVAVIAAGGLPTFLGVLAPRFGGDAVALPLALIVPVVGYAGIAFGIWWMHREYTAGLRADSDTRWRYRDR